MAATRKAPAAAPLIDSQSGNSPLAAAVPFWVTACVRLNPPRRPNGAAMEAAGDKVLTAAQALIADRTKAHGDAAVELDRDLVAALCGYSSAKKCGWILDYLESIGFLMIQRHYSAPGRGRKVDTFVTFDEPPLNYVGPRSYAEVVRALRDPDRPLAAILFVDKNAQTRRSGRRFPDGDLQAGARYPDGDLSRVSAGQAEGSQMGTFRPEQGTQMGTLLDKPAGQAEGADLGTFTSDLIDLSPRGERDRSEPVPGGTAEPPATGLDERQVAAVREMVRQMPWARWAELYGPKFRLSPTDADVVHAAICKAMVTAGINLDQAAEIALTALSEARAKPVKYVEDAFGPKHLARRVRSLGVEPLSDNPLPLPGDTEPENAPAAPARKKPATAKPAAPAKPVLGKCDTCKAREDDDKAKRRVEGPDGRLGWCPDCLPDEAA